MPTPYPTSTSQWSLVVHRVGQRSVEVWVGTLFPALKMPAHARVRLFKGDREIRVRRIGRRSWRRPFTGMNQRFFTVVTFRRLDAGSDYRLVFERRIEANRRAGITRRWQQLRTGAFRTLPSRLPQQGRGAFTIALGSCFYPHRDGGRAAAAYKALYDRGHPSVRPDVTVLTGDQVYLDIGLDSLSFFDNEIRQRIADDYALHWQALGSLLSRGGTWMLPDDHEYWNDYPFTDSWNPNLVNLQSENFRQCWERATRDGVRNIQRPAVVETVTLGRDLSICWADLRSHRSESEDTLLPDDDFNRLLNWAKRRSCPGVLVIPQPLIVLENKVERNLRSYHTQYTRLLDALGSAPHDVVVLSGDVHFGRIAAVPIGDNGARLIEIIASPLSNLTGINGLFATSVATDKPKRFPPPAVARDLGWPPRPVNYYKKNGGAGAYFVPTRPGRLFSAYFKASTHEHIMTITFTRRPTGIALTATAWFLRHRTPTNLPQKAYPTPYKTTLR